MNFLMLRGAVPKDRNSSEIVFDRLSDCDDVWTQLFYSLLNNEDYGELWYWGGTRQHKFNNNFVERWIPDFACYSGDYVPDVIFCRGGFLEYHSILKRFPKAVKIYYGAGRRFLPQPGFNDYDIILQDSVQQLDTCKKFYKDTYTTLFIKPASDNIFYPLNTEKSFDVCFPANGAQKFKGHKFIYSTIPKDISLLNLGNNPHNFKYPSNVNSYRVLRSDMRIHINKCKVGVVAVSSEIDSCPRVIPELLACNLPVVVMEGVRFWDSKYIVSGITGEMANESNFWDVVKYVLNNLDRYTPRAYYDMNLSLPVAAKFIRDKIDFIYSHK